MRYYMIISIFTYIDIKTYEYRINKFYIKINSKIDITVQSIQLIVVLIVTFINF